MRSSPLKALVCMLNLVMAVDGFDLMAMIFGEDFTSEDLDALVNTAQSALLAIMVTPAGVCNMSSPVIEAHCLQPPMMPTPPLPPTPPYHPPSMPPLPPGVIAFHHYIGPFFEIVPLRQFEPAAQKPRL